jgi:hypothetical protein
MDVLSHGLWGYAVLRWRGPRSARWGFLAGVVPDVLFFLPGLLRQVAERGVAALTEPVTRIIAWFTTSTRSFPDERALGLGCNANG